MLDQIIHKPHVVARLRGSVLGRDLDELAAVLHHLGYRPTTVHNHLRAAGHLAHWLSRERIPLRSLDEATIHRFVHEHLPHCRCPVPRSEPSDIRGLAPHLLRVLRARRRVPPSPALRSTPIGCVLQAFTEHLRRHRGAAEGTCDRHGREIRQLLERTCSSGPVDLARLTPSVLRAFVVERASRYSLRSARRTASVVRSFLRFLHVDGRIDGTLMRAVPTVRSTRRSKLPPVLSSAGLARLLASCDRTKPVQQRDYAMLLCLSQLGLRAKEVATLTLNDLDWHAGTVTIAMSKVRRPSVLPLPVAAGRAITAYLRHGRPATPARQVFVRHFFPVGIPLRSHNVSHAVRRAFRRSGLTSPARGAHLLRHTAATEMVRAGASLKAVADVLRHRSIDTTSIYTRVDLPRLREVALPWPEVRP